jgi:hypothetical protein
VNALIAFVFALLLFGVNNLNLISAWSHPPQGWNPVYIGRDLDVAQHLTWINDMRDHWLSPDFHAPVVTRPGLFSPLMWSLGHVERFGIDASLVYVCAQFLLYFIGSYALLGCLQIFTASRIQAYSVLLCIVCVLPVGSFAGVAKFLAGRTCESPVFYGAHDGFFLQGPLTLTVGTVAVLVSLALIGSYVRSGKNLFLMSAGAVTGLSGLLHPFEVFAIMAGASLSFFCIGWPRLRRPLTESLAICLPGALAVLPYVWFSSQVDWMSRITKMNQPGVDNLQHILSQVGIPATVALTVLVIGPRMQEPLDIVLQCWFAGTLIMLNVPRLPFWSHLLDGFAAVTALLLVRQFSTLPSLNKWLVRRRKYAFMAGGAVFALSLAAQSIHRYVAFRDGNRVGGWSVASHEEVGTIAWLRKHGKPQELVLVPQESAPWVATVPIHAWASHWLFSMDYLEQQRLSNAFYAGALGEDGVRRFLQDCGVNYVAVPLGSPVAGALSLQSRAAQIGSWSIYYFPENRMRPYDALTLPSECAAHASDRP